MVTIVFSTIETSAFTGNLLTERKNEDNREIEQRETKKEVGREDRD
jgi:hypothetical protein